MATFSGGEALTKTITINEDNGGRMNTSTFDPYYTCPAGKYAVMTIIAFPQSNWTKLYLSSTTGTNFTGSYSQLLFEQNDVDVLDIEVDIGSQSPAQKRAQLRGSRINGATGNPTSSGTATNYEFMILEGESLGRSNNTATTATPFICFIREYNLIP